VAEHLHRHPPVQHVQQRRKSSPRPKGDCWYRGAFAISGRAGRAPGSILISRPGPGNGDLGHSSRNSAEEGAGEGQRALGGDWTYRRRQVRAAARRTPGRLSLCVQRPSGGTSAGRRPSCGSVSMRSSDRAAWGSAGLMAGGWPRELGEDVGAQVPVPVNQVVEVVQVEPRGRSCPSRARCSKRHPSGPVLDQELPGGLGMISSNGRRAQPVTQGWRLTGPALPGDLCHGRTLCRCVTTASWTHSYPPGPPRARPGAGVADVICLDARYPA